MANEQTEEKLNLWLDELEDALDQGNPLKPEDICTDEDLLPILQERFEKILKMNSALRIQSGNSEINSSPLNSTSRTKSQNIGRYKLLQQIGSGGMGTVWMAEQKEPIKRRVALKIIRSAFPNKSVLARFEAERQALAMMDHQNIAKVFDAGNTDDGSPYFVMELVLGLPITEFCEKKKLSIPQRLVLFQQVCEAIQHAHSKGIIHRDIKPSNVLVSEYEGKPIAKVIDFGIAKALQADLTDKTYFTEFGQILGTFLYMSPEQTEMNALLIDTRTDVYSLGILLYELLTGQTLISAEALAAQAVPEVLRRIHSLEPPKGSDLLSTNHNKSSSLAADCGIDLETLRSTLRGDIDAILMKATANERNRRYVTALDFSRDLDRFLKNEPVEARPPSQLYYFRKFITRNRGKVIAFSTAVILLVAGIIGTSFGLLRALDAQARAKNVAIKNLELAERESSARIVAEQKTAVARKANLELAKKSRLSQANLLATEAFLLQTRNPTARRSMLNKAIEAAEATIVDDGIISDTAERALRQSLKRITGNGLANFPSMHDSHSSGFSASGRWLVADQWSTTEKVWDLKRKTPFSRCYELEKHHEIYHHRWVVDTKHKRLWDLEQGNYQDTPPEFHRDSETEFKAMSPDGCWFLFKTNEKRGLLIGRDNENVPFQSREFSWPEDCYVEFDPASRWLVRHNANPGQSVLNELTSKMDSVELEVDNHSSVHWEFNADGTCVCISALDNKDRVVPLKMPVTPFAIRHRIFNFNSDSSLLAVYDEQAKAVKIFDCHRTLSKDQYQSFEIPTGHEFVGVYPGPTKRRVVILTSNSTIVWNLETNESQEVVVEKKAALVRFAEFSPDGRWLALVSDSIQLYDLSTDDGIKLSRVLDSGDLPIQKAIGFQSKVFRFSPTGKFVVDVVNKRIWSLGEHDTAREPAIFCNDVGSLHFFSDDLQHFITNSRTHEDPNSKDKIRWIRLKDVEEGKSDRKVFPGHLGRTTAVALNVDRDLLVSGSTTGNVQVSRLSTGKRIMEARPHRNEVDLLRISPAGMLLSSDGRTLAMTDPDRPIDDENPSRRYTAKPNEKFRPFLEESGPLSAEDDSRYLLTSDTNRGLQLWDSKSSLTRNPVERLDKKDIWRAYLSGDAQWAVCTGLSHFPEGFGVWIVDENRFIEIPQSSLVKPHLIPSNPAVFGGFDETNRFAVFAWGSTLCGLRFVPSSSKLGKATVEIFIRSCGRPASSVTLDPKSGSVVASVGSYDSQKQVVTGSIKVWEWKGRQLAETPRELIIDLPGHVTEMRIADDGKYLFGILNGQLVRWTLDHRLLLEKARQIYGTTGKLERFRLAE